MTSIKKTYQHVLSEPAFPPRNGGPDAQREALLPQQRIPSVTAPIRNNLVALRLVQDDGPLRIARPAGHLHLPPRRRTNGMQTSNEILVTAQLLQDLIAHAGHDAHRRHHVRGVRQLDPDLRQRRPDGPHGERHDVHGSSAHATRESVLDRRVHVPGGHPVAQRAFNPVFRGRDCFGFLLRADEGLGFYAGGVRRVRSG